MIDVMGASCVSKKVSGKFNLCNFCFSSVEVRDGCPTVVHIVSSVAFWQMGQLLEVTLCRPVQRKQ